jgi:hypothetical protein
MKKVLIFMTVIVALLSACSKNQSVTSPASSSTTFPPRASEYITNNYPDATVDYIITMKSSQAKYIAVLNTTEELAFTQSGDFLGNGRLYHPGDSIPGDTTHCDSMPGWHHGPPGHGHHHHPPHGGPGPGDDGFGIPADSIPAAIISYVNTAYPGSQILHANYDSICPDGKVIEVMVGVLGTEPMKLFFDMTDNYLFRGNRFRYEDMPQAVKDYITASYSGYQVCPGGEKLTMPDSSLQYKVYLRQAGIRKCVRIKEDGTPLCVLE